MINMSVKFFLMNPDTKMLSSQICSDPSESHLEICQLLGVGDQFPSCLHCSAVQRICGVPDAAPAGEAGHQAGEPSVG